MRTTKKKVYKFSERSRMNQSKAGKRRWDAMTPEQQQEQIAKLQAARQQKRLEKMINEWNAEDTVELGDIEMPKPRSLEVARRSLEVARKLEPAVVKPADPTPMQKNLEILRVRVGKRVGFEVNLEQAVEYLVNRWGVQQ